MKSFVMTMLLVLIVAVTWVYVGIALDSPVVYKAINGEVCGCITPEQYKTPTLKACQSVDTSSMHEVVTVQNCK